MARPRAPPPPLAPDELADLSVDDGSPPLLSDPEDVDFTVVHASGKQRVTPLQHVSPTQAEHSPTPTGNSFSALTDTIANDASEEKAANSNDALYKAVIATSPEVGYILHWHDQKLDTVLTSFD